MPAALTQLRTPKVSATKTKLFQTTNLSKLKENSNKLTLKWLDRETIKSKQLHRQLKLTILMTSKSDTWIVCLMMNKDLKTY